MNIEYAGFKKDSAADGPGYRTVLFLQGCSRDCKGCHNAGISRHGEGTTTSTDNLINIISAVCHNKRLTISGGEPLEQYDALLEMVKALKTKGYDICLYTGADLSKVPAELFGYLNYIKTGEFITDMRNPDTQYYGSDNQSFYRITDNTLSRIA